MRPFYDAVEGVEVVDPLTARVHMKYPYTFFLHMLAGYRTGLVLYSPAATQKYSLEDRKKGKPEAVVGCGPFKLVEWVQGSHLAMDRWQKYFRSGLPHLDRVMIRTIKDPITQMAAFKAGEIDFIASFTPEHADTLKAQNPGAQILDQQRNYSHGGPDEGHRPQRRQAHVQRAHPASHLWRRQDAQGGGLLRP